MANLFPQGGTLSEEAENDIVWTSPQRLGFDLIQSDVMEEVSAMAHHKTDKGEDESFAVLDMGVVLKRFQLWKSCFQSIRPFYAVKACGDPAVINLLAHLGAGFSCSTKGELELVLELGVDPRRVIFTSVVKFPSHLKYATNNGVDVMTFDSKEELLKLKQHAPDARLLLRITPPEVDGIQPKHIEKFGCAFEDVREVLQEAQRLGVQVIGVSFHVGHGAREARDYIANISTARLVFDMAVEEGIHMEILDIGGGFIGDSYCEGNLKMISNPIAHTLECLFRKDSGVKFSSQPGRYFVEAALTLAMCVIGKRSSSEKHPETDKDDTAKSESAPDDREESPMINEEATSFEYFTSESKYGPLSLHRDCPGHDYRPIPLNKQTVDTELFKSKLWGASPDPSDVIQECCHLPELCPGDWLAVEDVGAYTLTRASTYSGLPPCPVRRVVNQQLWTEFSMANGQGK